MLTYHVVVRLPNMSGFSVLMWQFVAIYMNLMNSVDLTSYSDLQHMYFYQSFNQVLFKKYGDYIVQRGIELNGTWELLRTNGNKGFAVIREMEQAQFIHDPYPTSWFEN